MKNLGLQRGSVEPKEVEITNTAVFVASNIRPYTQVIDDITVSGYEYNYTEYGKDEYIEALVMNNNTKIEELEEQLTAAKILLGVE